MSPRKQSEAVARAQQLFRAWAASESPDETADSLLELAVRLGEDDQQFGYARRVLEHVAQLPLTDAQRLLLGQRQALSTYKDRELRTTDALERALSHLGDLSSSTSPETLGLAGAVYKRLWEVDGQRRHLELAHDCYRRGYELGDAYPGINAAFVLDLLASEEETDAALVGTEPMGAEERRAVARRLRTEIVARLEAGKPDHPWWYPVTLVEAHLGLGQFGDAARYAEDAAASGATVAPW